MSTYQASPTDSYVETTSHEQADRFLAQQLASRGITTDAQFSAFIDGLTTAQFEAWQRAAWKKFVKVTPP